MIGKAKTEHYAAALMDIVMAECETSGEGTWDKAEAALKGALKKLHSRGFSDWPALLHNFEIEIDSRLISKKARVISATPLTSGERREIVDSLGGQEIGEIVDPKVLGGVRIESDGRVVDATIKTLIEKLRLALSAKE